MRRLLSIFLILFSTVCADELESPLVPSSPEQLSLYGSTPTALINGLVDPQSCKLNLQVTDLFIKGAQNLTLQRTYFPSTMHAPFDGNDEKDFFELLEYFQVVPFHDWSYLPHLKVHEVLTSPDKKMKHFRESTFHLSHPNGTVLTFRKGYKSTDIAVLETPTDGMTNVSGDTPGSIYYPKNTTLTVSDDHKTLTVTAPDGNVRSYLFVRSVPLQYYQRLYNQNCQTNTYILKEERLPNGKRIAYEWDPTQSELKSIKSLPPTDSTPYATIQINRAEQGELRKTITFTTNDQTATYTYERSKAYAKPKRSSGSKARKIARLSPFYLTKVSSPYYNEEIKLNRFLISEYDSQDHHFDCIYSTQSSRELPIHSLRFCDGKPFDITTKGNTTIVSCTNHTSIKYTYTPQHRLESILYYEKNQPKKTKHFTWTPEGFLNTVSIHDHTGKPLKITSYTYDSLGNPITETLSGDLTGDGSQASYTIHRTFARHLITEEREDNGLTTQYTYLPHTNLVTEKNTLFDHTLIKQESHSYDHNNNLIKTITANPSKDHCTITTYTLYTTPELLDLPEWTIETYIHNGQELPLKKTHLHYDTHHNIIQEEIYDAQDTLAYTLDKTYDQADRLTSETNPLGQKATYTYDKKGNLIRKTNFSKRLTTTSTFDLKKRLLTQTETPTTGTPHPSAYTYDLHDHLTQKTDHFDNITTYIHDPLSHQPIRKETPAILSPREQPVITLSHYDPLGNLLAHADANGNTTTYTYTARGQLATVRHPNHTIETYTYTPAGHPATYIDQEGITTSYTYDPLGRILSKTVTSPSGIESHETFRYDAFHLLSHTDTEGYITHFTYDGAGRKINEERAGRLTEYTYNPLGHLTTIIHHNGHNTLITHLTKDPLDRTLEKNQTDTSGEILSTISYTYDADGNQATITRNIDGHTSVEHCTYDPFQRLIENQDPLGYTETTTYDETTKNPLSQKILKTTTIDPHRIAHITLYDPYRRITHQETLDPKGHRLSLHENTYDPNGNLLEQRDHIYENTTYKDTQTTLSTYTPANQLESLTRAYRTPYARTTLYTYTPANRLHTKTLPDTTTLTYTYTPLGHLHTLTSSDGSIHHTFTYNTLEELTSATDENTNLTIQRTLDPFGNILREEFPNDLSIETTYDTLNRPLTITPSHLGHIHYTYDPLYLRTVTRESPTGEILYTHTYDTYDPSGNPTSETPIYNLGTLQHTYDEKGRPTTLTSPYLSQECTYDPQGNLLQTTLNNTTQTYTYDNLSRLTSEPSHTYTNDSLYNQTHHNHNPSHINPLNELLTHDETTLTYDPNGNQTQNNTTHYTYDPLNRLIHATTPTQHIHYTYDPLGRLLIKTSSTQENYLYLGTYELAALTPSNTPLHLRIPGLPTPKDHLTIAIELSSKPYAPILDIQHNIRLLIDPSTQKPTHTYTYTAFGSTTATETIFNPYRFSSKRFDPTLNLYTFGARYYNPSLSRFLTTDPAGPFDSTNLYQFLLNNPFKYQDPTGEFVFLFAVPLLEISIPLIAKLVADTVIVSTVAWLAVESHASTMHKIHEKENQRHTPNQEALSDLAKESGRRGISNADAETLLDWAKEYDYPHRDDRGKRDEQGNPHWEGGEHIHLGPKHVKVN